MSPGKIQFRCPGCSKSMAVAAIHAGKRISCPNCQKALRLPGGPTRSVATGQPPTGQREAIPKPQVTPAGFSGVAKRLSGLQPASGTNASPEIHSGATAPRATRSQQFSGVSQPLRPADQPVTVRQPLASERTGPHVPTVSAPTGGADGSEVTNPFAKPTTAPGDAMGGVPGVAPGGVAGVPVALAGVQGLQPGSPAAERARQQAAAVVAAEAAAPPPPSLGRSVGGLFGAAVIAFFFCAIWLIIEVFSGGRMGILAWALGGLLGLVAGAIAKTPSKGYAATVAALAIFAIVMAKFSMAGGIMLASKGLSMADEFMSNFSPDADKHQHALADDLLAQGQLDGAREEFAKSYTKAYFAGELGENSEDLSPEAYEIEEAFRIDLRNQLKELSNEEKEALVAASRKRHLLWIEDQNHYEAILFALSQEPESLTEKQNNFVRAELSFINEEKYSASYHGVFSQEEIQASRSAVRKLAAERLNKMDEPAIDRAIRQVMKARPHWNPFSDATTAMTAKMLADGEFQSPLKEQVTADLEIQFDPMSEVSSGYYETANWELIDDRSNKIKKMVTTRLAEFDKEQRDVLVADVVEKHPQWMRSEIGDEERQAVRKEQIGDLGDGTFLSSLGVVTGPFDLLWMIFAGSTAFATTRKFGTA